jgi:glycerol dehydrogenase-like iron-containing ADH family enzyme
MPTHPMARVRFESVACLNPLLDESLLVVDPQAWFAARAWLTANPRSLARAESLDARALDALLNAREAFDGVARIIGLGGDTAIDTAKYLAWRTGLPLILVPSALTVDAPFTDSAAVRRDGRIHYTGSVAPEAVIVDAALIRTAPAHLNRGGVGDILSIHTALYDWRLAHAHRRTLRRGDRPAERVAAEPSARPEPRDLRRQRRGRAPADRTVLRGGLPVPAGGQQPP